MASECPNCHHATLHPQGMCLRPDCGCTSDVPEASDPLAAIKAAAKALPPEEKTYKYKVWYIRGGSADFTVKANQWRDYGNKIQYGPAVSKSDRYVELTQVNGKITTIPWTSLLQIDALPDEAPDELDDW